MFGNCSIRFALAWVLAKLAGPWLYHWLMLLACLLLSFFQTFYQHSAGRSPGHMIPWDTL